MKSTVWKARPIVNHISAQGSTIVVGNTNTQVGGASHTEMETALLQIFQGFTTQQRVEFLQFAYHFKETKKPP